MGEKEEKGEQERVNEDKEKEKLGRSEWPKPKLYKILPYASNVPQS